MGEGLASTEALPWEDGAPVTADLRLGTISRALGPDHRREKEAKLPSQQSFPSPKASDVSQVGWLAQDCDPSTPEAEARGSCESVWATVSSKLARTAEHREPMSQTKTNKKIKKH